MHPKVNSTYQQLAEKYDLVGPFLEVGVGNREDAILSGSYFLGKAERYATNLSDKDVLEDGDQAKIEFIRCNSNDMSAVFAEGQFGTVLSNAVIEHDKYFWRSLDEMKRILAPGGVLVIGAPAYVPRKELTNVLNDERLNKATITMDVHSAPDYWRFSRMAFKEVICEGLEVLELCVVGRVPVIIAVARKPANGLLPPVAQEDRVQVYQAEKAARSKKREEKIARADASPPAEPRKAGPTEEEKLLKRAARVQAREVKMQAREERVKQRNEAAAAEVPPETEAAEIARPETGKLKSFFGRLNKNKRDKQ